MGVLEESHEHNDHLERKAGIPEARANWLAIACSTTINGVAGTVIINRGGPGTSK